MLLHAGDQDDGPNDQRPQQRRRHDGKADAAQQAVLLLLGRVRQRGVVAMLGISRIGQRNGPLGVSRILWPSLGVDEAQLHWHRRSVGQGPELINNLGYAAIF